jgi:hypothetical protein
MSSRTRHCGCDAPSRVRIVALGGHASCRERTHRHYSANPQYLHGDEAHSEHMDVVTQLLATLGTVTAVVLLVLMAAVPLLVDLPLERRGG